LRPDREGQHNCNHSFVERIQLLVSIPEYRRLSKGSALATIALAVAKELSP